MKRVAIIAAVALLFAVAVYARIGGGQTYSGGSSSSSRSSGGGSYSPSYSGGSSSSSSGASGDDIGGCGLVFIFLIVAIILIAIVISAQQSTSALTVQSSAEVPPIVDMSALRRFDPNFSEIVFTDFCYSLYARLYEALGRGAVDNLAPYVDKGVRDGLKQYAAGLTSIDEIVIGSFAVVAFRGIDTPWVEADVDFESNYTESRGSAIRRFYVRERWTLTRARDVLSPVPEKAKAQHCPKCGAPLQTRSDGACLHCGTIVRDGSFQWFVRTIRALEKDERPRDLGGSAPESGTDNPTIYQPRIAEKRQDFTDWTAFEQRVRLVANELQAAWTSRDWKRAQSYETGALFQMHRYWIDEYLRQHLRNVVENFKVGHIEVVKIARDAFYDAITVRMYASGQDYTVDENGTIVGGSPIGVRRWSEYWTFIRSRTAAAADAHICPNCGAPLADGQSVVCDYCGGKITTGEFPWLLSRIEQDDSYRG